MKVIPQRVFERIGGRYQINSVTGCWSWTGTVDKDGYGKIHARENGVLLRFSAHRLSYLLHCGDIPEGLWVLHRCDNPGCINPDHLFLGTIKDNVKDMNSKGRHAKGEKDPMAKITESDVLKIYELRKGGMSQRAIAELFNISGTQVSNICAGKNWTHLYNRCMD